MAETTAFRITIGASSTVRKGIERTIVAVVGDADTAEGVFDYATRYYANAGDMVVFVFVASPSHENYEEYSRDTTYERRELVQGWLDRAAQLPNTSAQFDAKVLAGLPGEELVAFCDALEPDALVVGSRKRSGFERWLSADTGLYCAEHCSCPVIVVKGSCKQGRSHPPSSTSTSTLLPSSASSSSSSLSSSAAHDVISIPARASAAATARVGQTGAAAAAAAAAAGGGAATGTMNAGFLELQVGRNVMPQLETTMSKLNMMTIQKVSRR